MAGVKILTDSTADLDKKTREHYNIHMIPLTVYFGEKSYKDGIEMLPDEFYKELRSNPNHPKTSQPTPEDFKTKYEELLKDSSDVISLHISSKMSGTYQSAHIAKKELNTDKIHIIDSEYVAFLLGRIGIECAQAANQGKSANEIIELISRIKSNMYLYFIVDTLDYLQKGGRIGKASALIGGLLNIKPILQVKDGLVTPYEKKRGTKKALFRMTELLAEFLEKHKNASPVVVLAHADAPELMNQFTTQLNQVYDCSKTEVYPIGSVVGAHVGPGALAIGFYITP